MIVALRRLRYSKCSGVMSRQDVCEQLQERRSLPSAYLLEGVTTTAPLSVYATPSGNSSRTTLQLPIKTESKSVIWRSCFLIFWIQASIGRTRYVLTASNAKRSCVALALYVQCHYQV